MLFKSPILCRAYALTWPLLLYHYINLYFKTHVFPSTWTFPLSIILPNLAEFIVFKFISNVLNTYNQKIILFYLFFYIFSYYNGNRNPLLSFLKNHEGQRGNSAGSQPNCLLYFLAYIKTDQENNWVKKIYN